MTGMRGGLTVRRLAGIACLTLLAGGCAAAGDEPYVEVPAERQFTQFEKDGVDYAIDVYDPLEGFNRGVYKFNARFDQFVFLPIVNAYETVTPDFVETRVSNFFANLSNITTFANSALQLDIEKAVQTFWRFAFNTTVGVLGLFDPATGLAIPNRKEDFGQTLGYWGVGDGAFLVLPIFGPSNVRDTAGLAVDTVAFAVVDPLGASSIQSDYPPILGLNVINQRKIQPFRYYESGSPFEYDLVRMLYTKKRRLDIQN
jgi:phospholipid-binding lipoprotein MlaA